MKVFPLALRRHLRNQSVVLNFRCHSPLKNRLDLSCLVELDTAARELAKLQGPGTPRSGWVKTVRLALAANSETLGRRIGISPQGVRQLEKSEADGSISLNTLAKIADGLNCDVRYVLVPRISLVDQVMVRARALQQRRGSDGGGSSPVNIDGQSLVVLASLLSRIDQRTFWRSRGSWRCGLEVEEALKQAGGTFLRTPARGRQQESGSSVRVGWQADLFPVRCGFGAECKGGGG